MPGGNCNTKAGDLVGVAEVTDLFVFGRNGQRCDSNIQRAVRNPVQQTLKVPLLKFEWQVQRGGNLPPEINADPRPGALTILHCKWGPSLVPTISVRLGMICPCASMEMPARIITNTYDPSQSFYEIHFVSLQN